MLILKEVINKVLIAVQPAIKMHSICIEGYLDSGECNNWVGRKLLLKQPAVDI